MITSFFPGRIRLRAPVFKDTVLVERVLTTNTWLDCANYIS